MEPVVIRTTENLALTTCPQTKKHKKNVYRWAIGTSLISRSSFNRIFIIITLAGLRFQGRRNLTFDLPITDDQMLPRSEPVFQTLILNVLHTDRIFKSKRKISRGKLVSHGSNCASNEGCIVDTWYSHDGWHSSRLFTSGVVTSHFSRFETKLNYCKSLIEKLHRSGPMIGRHGKR